MTTPSTHRVLITGFYDWRELGEPPALERCRDNPSCRVLAGEGMGPRDLKGPLATLLRSYFVDQGDVHLEFKLLTVTWGSATQLTLDDYDQVIHLGLGVYDSFHRVLIESGAYNYRDGTDAAGHQVDDPIVVNADKILSPSKRVRAGLQRALDTSLPSPFKLVKIDARRSNTYLCNETHYRALNWIQDHPRSRLKEAYFVHIPHREGDDDQALARALSPILISLIHSSKPTPQN
jgi:pyrrolidone-carboxylate peptidase